MSTKKPKTNGAVHAPVPTIVEEPIDSHAQTTNGKSANGNGSPAPAFGPSEFDGMIDQRQLLKVLAEMRNGNFSVRMPNDSIGISGKIYDTLNDILTLNE